MFGLSKLFSSKSAEKAPIIAVAAYRSSAFAIGIEQDWLEELNQNSDKLASQIKPTFCWL